MSNPWDRVHKMGANEKPSGRTKAMSYLSVLLIAAVIGAAIYSMWPIFMAASSKRSTRRAADRVLEKETTSSFKTRAAIGGGVGLVVGAVGLAGAELRKRGK